MTDIAWVGLSLTGRIGNKTLQALLKHFDGDTSAILRAEAGLLRQVPGIGPKITQSIQAIQLRDVEKALVEWRKRGVSVWTLHDEHYPALLRELDDAPPTLFVRGAAHAPNEPCVAIVGTRTPSPAARNFAQNLSTLLVEKGYMVVSGLALGIDSAAHLGVLAVPEGKTTAVLGCGVLNVYPSAHERLAQKILLQGLVMSEVNPNASPSPSSLVARNRIITGLCQAVIVVETAVDGGAMHAARFAAAQGRPVYTLDSAASGNQALIASGAAVIDYKLADVPF